MEDTSKYKNPDFPPFCNGELVVATHEVTKNPHCGFTYGKEYRIRCQWKEWYNENHQCWVRMWYVGVKGHKDGGCYYAPYLFSSLNTFFKKVVIRGNWVIPPIEDPMGKYWDQPPTSDIVLTDRYALLTKESRKLLHVYDSSYPTGVYVGKMFERQGRLVWISKSEEEGYLNYNYREIIERPQSFLQ